MAPYTRQGNSGSKPRRPKNGVKVVLSPKVDKSPEVDKSPILDWRTKPRSSKKRKVETRQIEDLSLRESEADLTSHDFSKVSRTSEIETFDFSRGSGLNSLLDEWRRKKGK